MNYPYYFIQLGPTPPRLIKVTAGAPHLAWIKLAEEWSGRHMTSTEARDYLETLGVVVAYPEEYV